MVALPSAVGQKYLGLATVAEGVETAEQLAELRSLGCDRAQGFYFSRPQPPEVEITRTCPPDASDHVV